ncbi:MAG: hypothetical protein RIC30_14905 [Marinoscillum sp.]|uniref:hypothetical protein n=1 Tax=Marinoscillum sp. TaxID=2024838 RepID=UPI003304A902
MKNLFKPMITLLLALTLSGVSYAAKEPAKSPIPITHPISAEESNLLLLRLDEIKAMDKGEMSSMEKKALRKEVKSIQGRLATGGVYVSVGALIIIILLLIILL